MHRFLQSLTCFRQVLVCALSIMLSSCASNSLENNQQQIINQALQQSYQFQQRPATLAAPAAFYVAPTSF